MNETKVFNKTTIIIGVILLVIAGAILWYLFRDIESGPVHPDIPERLEQVSGEQQEVINQLGSIGAGLEHSQNTAQSIYDGLERDSERVDSITDRVTTAEERVGAAEEVLSAVTERIEHAESTISDSRRLIEENERIFAAYTK